LAEEERVALERLAHSRTAPARLVERARIVWSASQGERAPQIAERLELDPRTVRTWLNRFNEQGLPALEDRPRSGRPVTYPPEVVAEVLATSLTAPKQLGQPFGCWSIRRLETYLNEERGIPIKRNRIDELLLSRDSGGGRKRAGSASVRWPTSRKARTPRLGPLARWTPSSR